MTLATRIRVARRKTGLSQRQLATTLGVNRSAVANWECIEGAKPAVANLIRVATTTRVCFDWLATGRGEMHLSMHKHDTVPAESDVVEDSTELRLLRAWRRSPARLKLLLLELAEAYTPAARPPKEL